MNRYKFFFILFVFGCSESNENIIIYENKISGHQISDHQELLNFFKSQKLSVNSEIAHSDGPSYFSHEFKDAKGKTIVLIEMNDDDSTRIEKIRFYDKTFKDVYGVTIDDSVSNIIKNRKRSKVLYDFSQNVLLYFDDSNIYYNLEPVNLMDFNKIDFDNFETKDVIDWKVIEIILDNTRSH